MSDFETGDIKCNQNLASTNAVYHSSLDDDKLSDLVALPYDDLTSNPCRLDPDL